MVIARRKLKIHEVSVTKKGANPGARVFLFKSDDPIHLKEEKMNPIPEGLTKAQAYKALRQRAQECFTGVTVHQAVAKYCATTEGTAARKVVDLAPGSVMEPQEVRVKKGDPHGSAAFEKIMEEAEKLRKENPSLTIEQARVCVYRERRDLLRQYDVERAEAIQQLN